MTPKDITVFLEQGPAWRERLQYAGHLAAHWQAHLVAVFVVDALDFHPYCSSAIGGGLTEMLHNHMASTQARSDEHTSELQSLMRIYYAVFCLQKKNHHSDTLITLF